MGMFSQCTNLTQAPKLPATSLADYCYMGIFSQCTNLAQAPKLPATSLADYCYMDMFSDCERLTDAPELPAETLAVECYRSMFNGCYRLAQTPTLPALTMKQSCYNKMFYNCTNLTNICELPATTLDEDCYKEMFSGCTSMTKAPYLPATELKPGCYREMFSNCSNLSEITVGFLFWDDNSTTDWVANVAPTGTFTRPIQLTEEYSDNRIPIAWSTNRDENPDSSSVEPENCIIWTEGLTLFVSSKQENVNVYNINGQLIYSAQGKNSKSHTFTMPAHGIFIIRTGNRNYTVEL